MFHTTKIRLLPKDHTIWKQYHTLHTRIFSSSDVFPPKPFDSFFENKYRWLTHKHIDEYAILHNGEMIAFLSYYLRHPNSPHKTPFLGFGCVYENVPLALINYVEKLLLQHMDASGHDFVVAYGNASHHSVLQLFKHWGLEAVNYLDFFKVMREDIRWDLLKKWLEAISLDELGLTLRFFNDIPEALYPQYAPLIDELSNGIMRPGIHWKCDKDIEYCKFEQETLKLQNKEFLYAYLFDENDRLIGLSECYTPKGDGRVMQQAMTGVSKSWQGKKLAKYMKAAMAYEIDKRYPHFEQINTDSIRGNLPMRSINAQMGFSHIPDIEGWEYIVRREHLA